MRTAGATQNPGVRFGPYRTVSFDGGSSLKAPGTARNRAWLGSPGCGGYPLLELMTLVETGTRALIGAVFGPTGEGETGYARRLLHLLKPDMLVLWDISLRNPEIFSIRFALGANRRMTWPGSQIRRAPFDHLART